MEQVRVQVQVPTKLTEFETELLKKLAEARGEEVQTEHAARVLGGRGELHDRDAGGVGRQHRVRIGDDLVERGPQAAAGLAQFGGDDGPHGPAIDGDQRVAVRDLDLAFAAALASPTPAQGDEVKK